MQDYYSWERDFVGASNSITAEEISANPRDYLCRFDPSELKYLLDIEPPEGSIFIKSVTEPVDEEMELDQKRINNWLKYFKLYPYKQLHCSGHASGGDLEQMINQIKPKTVIPIHTEHPEIFNSFNIKVVEKELGETYEISF